MGLINKVLFPIFAVMAFLPACTVSPTASGDKMAVGERYRPKVLAFAGSVRADSYNKKLAQIAMQGAKKAGAEVTYIDLKDYPLPMYDQDAESRHGLPENVLTLQRLMREHDGFLIASPEYNASMPALLKNMLDWTSRKATKDAPSCFAGKVVVLMSASPGKRGGARGLDHVRDVFRDLHSIVLPQHLSIARAHLAFQKDGTLQDTAEQEAALHLGCDLVRALEEAKRS